MPHGQRTPATLIKGLAALTALATLTVGAPIVLSMLSLSVLPQLPLNNLSSLLTRTDNGAVLLSIISVAGWVLWAMFTWCVIRETSAAIRTRGRRVATPAKGLSTLSSAVIPLVQAAVVLFIAIPAATATAATDAYATPAPSTTISASAQPAPSTAAPSTAATSATSAGSAHASTDAASTPTQTTTSKAAAAPSPSAPRTVTVAKGDTLWALAEKHLGDPLRWREIKALNSTTLSNGNDLDVGQQLILPTSPANATGKKAPAHSVSVEVVKEGDTLSEIAAKHGISDVDALARANKGTVQPDGERLTDPDHIEPGWTITIPATSSTAPPSTTASTPEAATSPQTTPVTAAPVKAPPTAPPATANPPAQSPLIAAPAPAPVTDKAATREQRSEEHVTPYQAQPPSVTPATPQVHDQLAATREQRGEDLVTPQVPSTPPSQPSDAPAPSTPATMSVETSPVAHAASAAAEDAGDRDHSEFAAFAFTAGGLILAGGSYLLWKQLQRRQARHRRPGTVIAPLRDPQARAVRVAVDTTGAAAAPSVERLDLALRSLTHSLREADRHPVVLAVGHSTDVITVRLQTPDHQAPVPWITDESGYWWTLPSTVRLEEVDVDPAWPALATIGMADSCRWLLNLEASGLLSVSGDESVAAGLARFICGELSVNPWSANATVICLGMGDTIALINPDRVTSLPGTDDDANRVIAELRDRTALAHELTESHDTIKGRTSVDHPDTWTATVVILGEEHTMSIEKLAELITAIAHTRGTVGISAIHHTQATPEAPGIVCSVDADGNLVMATLGMKIIAEHLTPEDVTSLASFFTTHRDVTGEAMPPETSDKPFAPYATADGAVRPELTIPRDVTVVPTSASAPTSTALPLDDEDYLETAATTKEDLNTLSPQVPANIREEIMALDPTLDQDLASWFNPECPLPCVKVLGPIEVTMGHGSDGEKPTKQLAHATEVATWLATRTNNQATAEHAAAAFKVSRDKARAYIAPVRGWLGNSPLDGQKHIPDARGSEQYQRTGVATYELRHVLLDSELFKRLRLRGTAQLDDKAKIADYEAALALVRGEPFTGFRPGGGDWAHEENLPHIATAAVVDLAHILVTHHLATNNPEKAQKANDVAAIAAPWEESVRADAVAIAEARREHETARAMLRTTITDRKDIGDIPEDLPERTEEIIECRGWNKRRAG